MGKKIVTYILSFFLAVCIFALLALSIFSNTILNKQYVLSALEENDYYSKVYYNIKDTFEEYSVSAGVEASELETIYTVEQVTADVNRVIDGIYENEEVKIDTSSIVEKIDNIINTKLEQNNRTPSTAEKKSIQTFESSLADAYVDNIAFVEKYIGQVSDVFAKALELVDKAWVAVIVAIAALVVVILVINRNLLESVKEVATALIASGALGIAVQLFVADKVQNILILSAAFSKTLVFILNSIIDTFFITGIALAAAGIVAVILSSTNTSTGKREAKRGK